MAKEVVFSVHGMTCTGCESNVQFPLSQLPGVVPVKADHKAKTVEIEFDPSRTSEAEIRGAVEEIGYTVITRDVPARSGR